MLVGNKKLLGFVLVCLLFVFNSCAKEDNLNFDSALTERFSGIAAFNGIEGTSNLELIIDGKVVNKTGEDFSNGGYLNHRTIFPGKRKLELKPVQGDRLYVGEKDFDPQKLYSYFFFDKQNGEPFVTEDAIIKPDPGKMKIRLVNLVTDSKIRLEFAYLNSKQIYDFPTRAYGFNGYSSSEDFKFNIKSVDKSFEDIEISLKGKDRSIYSIVIYTDKDRESEKRILKYNILEM